jgi:glycosyltransferase involved in cell wall biosynthesis
MCSAKLENAMLSWFHDKGVFIVSFIHDLTLIRYDVSKLSGYDSEGDKHVLTRFDANIVPQKFSGALNKIASVSLKNVISPEPYDFRINHTGNVEPASYDLQVVYAGSLSKFPDINNIDFDLTVFGEKNFSNINITNDNLHDGGFIPAEDLAQKLDKGFGLIWDEDADNVYRQNYTKWNWPYKFSLYMASGLPVIAWKHSAIAEIIESYQLGVIVESLSEISNVISGITPEEFHIMAEHAATFGNKLIHGESTKKAVKKLELMLSIM